MVSRWDKVGGLNNASLKLNYAGNICRCQMASLSAANCHHCSTAWFGSLFFPEEEDTFLVYMPIFTFFNKAKRNKILSHFCLRYLHSLLPRSLSYYLMKFDAHLSRMLLAFWLPCAYPLSLPSKIPALQTYQYAHSSTHLNAVSKEQVGILDGSNFNALELFTAAESGASQKGTKATAGKNDPIGVVRVVVGTLDVANSQDRVVGIAVSEDIANGVPTIPMNHRDGNVRHLHRDSICKVPKPISDDDAISTCVAALSGVHCAYFDPVSEDDKIVKGVGGSDDDFILPLVDESIEEVESLKWLVLLSSRSLR